MPFFTSITCHKKCLRQQHVVMWPWNFAQKKCPQINFSNWGKISSLNSKSFFRYLKKFLRGGGWYHPPPQNEWRVNLKLAPVTVSGVKFTDHDIRFDILVWRIHTYDVTMLVMSSIFSFSQAIHWCKFSVHILFVVTKIQPQVLTYNLQTGLQNSRWLSYYN